MTKRKHKRNNREKWDKAWALVQFWYAQLAKEGAVTYTVSGQKVSVGVPQDGAERDTLAQAKKDRPENWKQPTTEIELLGGTARVESMTADGRERRYILPQKAENGFWGVSTDPYLTVNTARLDAQPDDDGNRDRWDWPVSLEARVSYARSVMHAVGDESPDARRVLEMRAATWDFPAIAGELNCADPTARQYFSEGIGLVMMFRRLCKPGRF